ncbi:MAG: TetR/AcrR family transcriptional regulator [Ilumatobacteraceae bacterium]
MRTRSSLVKAARALFEKQGFLETNVGDIAARAKVAHGTFYTYFASKEDIFAEVVDELLVDRDRIADAEPPVREEAWLSERIERANRGYFNSYVANARMMAVLEQVATFNSRLAQVRRMARKSSVQRNADALRRWQSRGLIDPLIDPLYAANSLGAMVDRSAYVWIVLGEPFELEEAIVQLTRLYCNALRVPYHRDEPSFPDYPSDVAERTARAN